ncbi:MAG: DUF327 family protein [Synergistaceae bacterium]|nr:DUF327 family protein [Synergistaceae bacterium]
MRVKRGAESKVEGRSDGSARQDSSRQALAARPSFGASMGDAMEEIEVRELLERLGSVSAKLSIFPAERLLLEYRVILKELLARAMKGFSLRRDLKWRRTDRHTYVMIEKAESALGELENVFRQEGGRTRALQLMEEIKGCLISLLF